MFNHLSQSNKGKLNIIIALIWSLDCIRVFFFLNNLDLRTRNGIIFTCWHIGKLDKSSCCFFFYLSVRLHLFRLITVLVLNKKSSPAGASLTMWTIEVQRLCSVQKICFNKLCRVYLLRACPESLKEPDESLLIPSPWFSYYYHDYMFSAEALQIIPY